MCDLTCGYCPNKDMERSRTFMQDDVFDCILKDYVVPFKDINRFCTPTFIGHKDGEPLLNKKFPQQLKAVSDACSDMNIDIYSHGLMLPKLKYDLFEFLTTLPNRCRYLMSFHPYNHDGSVNDYSATVQYLRRVLLNPPPNVEFITVSHKSRWVTEATQEQWRQQWTGLPITVHCNASLNPWTGRIQEDGISKFDGCPYGDFGHMFFGVTGNAVACCLDLEEEIVFGNVLTDTPRAIFERLTDFYADQRARKVQHAVCHDCFGLPKASKELLQLGAR